MTAVQRDLGTVAVVAVTFSPGSSLDSFLDSLAGATTRPVDVVLADNGSTDGSPERAATRQGVRLLATGGNLGYGRAANAGVAATDAEWVVVANPDVVWTAGSLDQLLAAVQRWPRAGALGPLIRTADGAVYPSARAQPSLGRGVGHALLARWWPHNPWSAAYRQERASLAERTAGWLSGACLLLRREAFESVGGFDPSYFMYFEDVDLGARLATAGWLNVYVPTAEVIHAGSHATSRHAAAMISEHHRSAWRFLSRRYRGWRWLPVRVMLRVGLKARELVALRSGRTDSPVVPQVPTDQLQRGESA
ncbi:glycosyltransferase family 2 protein [Jatrophihabitans lederbergiae]|uniref:glycosyltransferase family 2 protein n=1 Tax=Jatrophihabitans lederbergiae TaxID=3075547 RepID=UPI0037BED3C6